MRSLLPNRKRQSTVFFVLVLAASMLAFATWLKIAPSMSSHYLPEATQLTKLWVDPSQASDNLAKLAPIGIFLIAPSLLLGLVREWSRQSAVAPRSSARDIFAESRHWFRPPPLI